jgi:8-hydroxy-5-deazaflavin:NADPH oxidoreductase
MKIGILGSGDVAKALAAGLTEHGHRVTLGTRAPAKLAEWVGEHPPAQAAAVAEAARSAELVVLAVKGSAASAVLRAAGKDNLAGKVVMDATNPIADEPPRNGVLRLFTTLDESLMERLQEEHPEARFVKAFNSVGSAHMAHPRFAGGPPTMFLCGNDEDARRTVAGLAEELGWQPVDMGTAEAARAIEPLCMLWCIPGFLRNDWDHAFKLLA